MRVFEEWEKEGAAKMRLTPMGKLLVKYGFEPWDTESSARRVAEKAAKEIAELNKKIKKLQGKNKELRKENESLRSDIIDEGYNS